MKWSGTKWGPDTDTTREYSAGFGLTLADTTFHIDTDAIRDKLVATTSIPLGTILIFPATSDAKIPDGWLECNGQTISISDANHDYVSVDEDCRLWLTHLMPDGWLILDDYVWLHGDGPRRVGDALLDQRAGQISCAFVSGQALFVQLR